MINASIFQLSIFILSIVLNIVLALFVYRNNPRSATNKIYALLAILITLWIITYYPSIFYENSLIILTAARLNAFVAALMNFVFFLFAHTLPNSKIRLSPYWMRAGIYGTLFTMIIGVSNYGYSDIHFVEGVPQLIPGPGLIVFAVQSLTFILATAYILVCKMRDKTMVRVREQAKFIMLGIAIMLLSMFFLVFIPVTLFQNNMFLPLSPFFGVIFLGMTAYAIVKHGFLDIKFMVARAISFIIANVLLAILYAEAIMWFVENSVYLAGTNSYLASVFLVGIGVLLFSPVERRIALFTDRIFFKGEYDKDNLNTKLTHIMAETIELKDLTDRMAETLKMEMRISGASFALVKNRKVTEVLGSAHEPKEDDLAVLGNLFHKKKGKGEYYLFEDLEEGKIKDLFRRWDISLVVPIRIENNEVVIFSFGPKLSGDIFYEHDIEFLTTFAYGAGIAIQNSLSYEEVKRFTKELEKMVEERTGELEASQKGELEKAQALAKLKDEFIYVAAHELRAPVTAIKGFIELTTEDTAGFSEQLKSDLNSIKLASNHLSTLVNDLLEVARSDGGTLVVDTSPMDIIPLVKRVTNEQSPMAKERGIKIKFNSSFEAARVVVNEEKTREILTNLINNAIKFNRENGAIDINISGENGFISVEVKDTGFGVPRAELGKIFGKFFRVKNGDTKGILGTGLGLFITKMLAEKMGGKVTFSSVEGVGSSFIVYFPKA